MKVLVLLCGLLSACYGKIEEYESLVRDTQFTLVGKFCFDLEGGTINLKAAGFPPGQEILLFHDFPEGGFPEIATTGHSCAYKKSLATNTVTYDDPLLSQGGKFYPVVSAFRARWWYVVVANCDEKEGDHFQQSITIPYLQIEMLNTAASYPHFGDDEKGIFETHIVVLVALMALLAMTVYKFLQQVKDEGQKIYQLTFCIGLILALELLSTIFKVAQYDAYQKDGVGHPGYLRFTTFLDIFPDTLMVGLFIVLSKGWQINESNFARLHEAGKRTTVEFLFFYFGCSVALFAWSFEELPPHESLWVYQSPPGYILVALHVLTSLWFLSNLIATYRLTKVLIVRTFYFSFGVFGFIYMILLPLLVLVASSLHDFDRMKCVVISQTMLDLLAYNIFFVLFCYKSDFLKKDLQEAMVLGGADSSYDDGMINMEAIGVATPDQTNFAVDDDSDDN